MKKITVAISAAITGMVLANTLALAATVKPVVSEVSHKTYNVELSKQMAFIYKVTDNKVKVVKAFNASVKGLTGFVLQFDNSHASPVVVYVNNKATYMVAGAVINNQGLNISYQDTQKYVAASASKQAHQDLKNTYSFIEGSADAPHKVTVVADPNCIFCHQFYQAAQPYVREGQLAIRWVMVGFLKPSSKAKAAAILTAKVPASALAQDEANFDVPQESGGISPLKHIPKSITQKLDANMNYFNGQRFEGTPVLIFTSKGKPQVIEGFIGGADLKHKIDTMDDTF